MSYRQYTHCVQPQDYNYPLPATDNALDVLAALFDNIELGNYLNLIPDACDYILGGKLVCLGGDQCAIGWITHFEPPSEKSFPSNIDNDFSFNILLAPQSLAAFAAHTSDKPDSFDKNQAFAQSGPQGFLITEQKNPDGSPLMPFPAEAGTSGKRWTGYSTDYPDSHYISFNPSDSPFQVPGSDGPGYQVPTFHLECEGSRAYSVCAAISIVTGGPLGSAICHAKILGIPFGRVICRIIAIILAPVLIPLLVSAAAAGWLAGVDGNAADAETGQSGTLNLGDLIVASGRWAYDAGHTGWNEFHPVKLIRKIDPKSFDPSENFNDFRKRWCDLTAQVPPFTIPGVVPIGMTPAQLTVYASQQQPENGWVIHPSIDGCVPANENPLR